MTLVPSRLPAAFLLMLAVSVFAEAIQEPDNHNPQKPGSMGVATKDVPPYHIVGGIPAKTIKVKTIAPSGEK